MGITDLTNAVNTLKSSRPASLMSLKSVIKTIRQAAFMGDAMGHSPKNQQVLAALLQQTPEVPMEDFTFHSEEIISMIEGLVSDFKTKFSEVKIEETKAVSDFDLQLQADTDERAAAAKELKDTNELKAEKMEAIAASSKELTETSATLTDDQNYLKDLTEKCNAKSKEWDQRSQMRQDELTALTTALTIVKEGVATKTTEKTVRLVQSAAKVSPHSIVTEDSSTEEADTEDDAVDELSFEDLAFVQLSSPRAKLSLVATGAKKFLQPDSSRDRVIALLKAKSSQLDSPVLAALATKAAADPFVKIKKLIQELIERLLQEAADEANHKGWCDKEFGKAKQSRQYKAEAVKTLNENLAKSEALRDKLTEEIAILTKEIDELEAALSKTTKERNDESAENAATVSEAQEGQAAVEQAIGVLEKFYKTAAKAEVLVQVSSKQVPDMPDAGFSGANKGSQSASTGILGMLDVIKSDFVRTIKETEKAEKAAAKEFMEFETTTKVSLGTKKVSKSAKEGELTETESSIDEDNTSLTEEQSLLDKAIQEIVELQPACVDTGMSYEERVAKREQEIEALKEALCTLDKEGPEQTEAECA